MHVIASLSGYGAERFVAALLPALAREGADVAALTVYPTRRPSASRSEAVPVFCAGRRARVEAGFFPRMVRAIRRFRPTIVHTHTHNGKYWGRLAAVAARVPHIVHTEHDPNFSPNAVERVADALLARVTDQFIAFSEGHRLRLARAERIRLSRIAVIPNGIVHAQADADARARGRALLGVAPDQLVVLMIGRLEAQKNHALALRAFARLADDVKPKARLFIAGDGGCAAKLHAQADALELADSVAFLGFRSDALSLLTGADAMLMTSRAEAMPIALIEAMGAAIPVVSTPWAGVEEMLDDGRLGTVAANHDPASVACALAQTLRDPAAARDKARCARQRALALYDLGSVARRHLELYRTLLESA